MKVQTTVFLLCFLSGVFLSSVVHAKPSPALMKELIALEKYLEKKQGSDGADDQTKNQDDNLSDSLSNPIKENNGNQQTENGQNNPTNENNNNPGGEEAVQENEKPDEVVQPAKPGEGVTPEKPEEGVTPKKPEEGVQEEVMNPQEGNEQSQSKGQEEEERDLIRKELEEATQKSKDLLVILGNIGDNVEKQFQNDDNKLNELKANNKKTKDKTIEKLNELETTVQEIKSDLPLDEKKSVRENAPARRSHLSDTEFLNIVHSLLTNN